MPQRTSSEEGPDDLPEENEERRGGTRREKRKEKEKDKKERKNPNGLVLEMMAGHMRMNMRWTAFDMCCLVVRITMNVMTPV